MDVNGIHPPDYGPRFSEAIRRFDRENARDPKLVVVDGVPQPHELLYARWVTDWVLRLCPQASEALFLAARCQHICRWMIPRSSYEMTRSGYLHWRNDLKKFHAKKSAEILREVGYADEMIECVQDLNLKKRLGQDPECQILEDALCLVTLQHQLADLIVKTDQAKLLGVLQKTWKKMSPVAREQASRLPYSEAERELIQQALTDEFKI